MCTFLLANKMNFGSLSEFLGTPVGALYRLQQLKSLGIGKRCFRQQSPLEALVVDTADQTITEHVVEGIAEGAMLRQFS